MVNLVPDPKHENHENSPVFPGNYPVLEVKIPWAQVESGIVCFIPVRIFLNDFYHENSGGINHNKRDRVIEQSN